MLTWLISLTAAVAMEGATATPTPGYGLPLKGAEAEEFLRTAEVVDVEGFDTQGVTRPRRVTLADGQRSLRAAFKDIDEYRPVKELADGQRVIRFRDSYRHEIAAYELDKLLALGIVPPCVERSIRGKTGALCLWVEGTITEWERLKVQQTKPPDPERWNEQMYTIRLFLQLIYDIDYQNISNLLVDPDFRIYKIDSSRAFRNEGKLTRGGELTRFSRSVLDRLTRLTPELAEERLGAWLTPGQVAGLMERRDAVLALAERRVSEDGEEVVLFP